MSVQAISEKVRQLPPYLFAELGRKKAVLQKKGIDVIDLGIGAPDLPTPKFIIDALIEEAQKPENHRYSPYSGCFEFRKAIAHFYKRQYGVELDPEKEVLTLIGSKEGLHHLIQTILNPGDAVILPNPGYPVYRTSVHLAGGKAIDLPLQAEQGFIPDYTLINKEEIKKAKMMLLNYPSNPTTATVQLNDYLKAITFAKENNLLLVNDMAYDLITFGDYKAPSALQVEGAKKHAVEFGSLSKSFNMTGWRIGYVVGNKKVIQALATLKSNIDSSQFLAVQKAAAIALESDLLEVKSHSQIFEERMELLYHALTNIGLKVQKPRGTIFLWVQVPKGYTSMSFADKLLQEVGILVTPGIAFGSNGEGYVRISLSVSKERLQEVIRRLKTIEFKGGT